MITHGRNILILKEDGSAVVAAARSCEISTACELIEICTPKTKKYREYTTGRTDWDITLNYLVTDAPTDLLCEGQTIKIMVGIRGSLDSLEGDAIIQSCKITATIGNLSQGSFVLKGTGPLMKIKRKIRLYEKNHIALNDKTNAELFSLAN